MVKQTTINCIYKNLQFHFGKHYNAFIRFIKTSNLMISGSFIIECILGEKYENSDIDVYIFTKIRYDKLRSLKIVTDNQYNSMHNYDYGGSLSIPIDHIVNYYLPSKKILQMISLENSQINSFEKFKDFVVNSYDIDICKNIFTIKDDKPKLYINNINKIISKIDVSHNANTPKLHKRIQKYESRGFTFYKKKWYDEISFDDEFD